MTESSSSPRLGDQAATAPCSQEASTFVRLHEARPTCRPMHVGRTRALSERERAVAARERQAEELLRGLNARESIVMEAEDRLAEMMSLVAAEAFAAGAVEERNQAAGLDEVGTVLALPRGLEPVPVRMRLCDYDMTARVVPGSAVSAGEVLVSLLNAVDAASAARNSEPATGFEDPGD